MVGKLISVPIQELWKHEAFDFSVWLFENCDILNEQLGLTISPIEKEKAVGSFRVDIWAEDSNGRKVIIENQFTKSDHDHLGKLLTYMSNLDAKVAIWISTDPRPEHVTAINYLNEVVPQDTHFYLVKLQAFRIGESIPAPQFTIVAGPSEEISARGKVIKESAEHENDRYIFFKQLLVQTNQLSSIFDSISPVGYHGWINTNAGKNGLMWMFTILKKTSRVEFFMNHSDKEINKVRYEKLLANKDEIELKFGEPLNWEFNESRKQQYIRSTCPLGGLEDEDKWVDIQLDMANRMVRLEKAIGPYINTL